MHIQIFTYTVLVLVFFWLLRDSNTYLVLCTVLKWRLAVVAKSMAAMEKSAKVWPFPYIFTKCFAIRSNFDLRSMIKNEQAPYCCKKVWPFPYISQCCTLLVIGCHPDFCHKTRKNFISQKVIFQTDSILPSN